MKKLSVAFDVDGTLIHQSGRGENTPRYEVIALLKLLESFGCKIYIWSGGGVDYAKRWAEKLNLHFEVIVKGSIQVDLAVDDFPSDDLHNESIKQTLGKVLLKV